MENHRELQGFSSKMSRTFVPSMVKLMQQYWITATEDLALVIQMFSSRQAADLLGRACEEK